MAQQVKPCGQNMNAVNKPAFHRDAKMTIAEKKKHTRKEDEKWTTSRLKSCLGFLPWISSFKRLKSLGCSQLLMPRAEYRKFRCAMNVDGSVLRWNGASAETGYELKPNSNQTVTVRPLNTADSGKLSKRQKGNNQNAEHEDEAEQPPRPNVLSDWRSETNSKTYLSQSESQQRGA